jgi:hypothetical protein
MQAIPRTENLLKNYFLGLTKCQRVNSSELPPLGIVDLQNLLEFDFVTQGDFVFAEQGNLRLHFACFGQRT